MSTLFEVELIWGDGELVIKGAPSAVLKPLHYYHKSLADDPNKPYSRMVKKEKVLLYRTVESDTVTTFQGFLQLVVDACKKEDVRYVIKDMRRVFPAPKLSAMKGFRHGQRLLLLQTLGQNRSGICKAPTRYGKTHIIANTLRAFPGMKTVVTAPGVNLLAQLEGDLKTLLPDREIRGIYTGSRGKKMSQDITLVSMDSLSKAEPDTVELVLVDEPHSVVSPSRIQKIMAFTKARIIGYGATIAGRFDGADKLIQGVIGPVLAEKTFPQAVAEGAICPIVVYFLKVPFVPWDCSKRDAAYRHLIYKNQHFNALVEQVLDKCVPRDWQTIIFVDEIKQADLVNKMVPTGVVCVAERMNREQREQTYRDMVDSKIMRCIATDIYATGLTFPDLKVMINTAGGGGAITSTQKPGRLAQVRPGKKAGYVVDFLFDPTSDAGGADKKDWQCVVNDCFARMNNYKKAGFDVRVVERIEDIKFE